MPLQLLQQRLASRELSNFIASLDTLAQMDIQALGEVEHIKHDSFITGRTFFFTPVLKRIDFLNIKEASIHHMQGILAELEKFEKTLMSSMHNFRIVDFQANPFSREDDRLIHFLKSRLQKLFADIAMAKKCLNELLHFPEMCKEPSLNQVSIHDQRLFADYLQETIHYLNEIKHFCAELEHYAERLKKEAEEKPYLDIRDFRKTNEYDHFIRQHLGLKSMIDETELKLQIWPNERRELHGTLRNVSIRGFSGIHPRHARIGDTPFRIIYIFNPASKVLTYISILHKDELTPSRIHEIIH